MALPHSFFQSKVSFSAVWQVLKLNFQTPLLREVFNRNQEHLGASEALANLGDLSGNIKEEIVTSNPPSVSPLERDVLEGPDKVMDKGDEIITMQMTGQEQTVVKQVALRVAEQATLLPSKYMSV